MSVSCRSGLEVMDEELGDDLGLSVCSPSCWFGVYGSGFPKFTGYLSGGLRVM